MTSEVTDVLVSTNKGFITWSDLQGAIERYTAMLPNKDLITQKSITFEGLIRFIYINIIKPIMPNSNKLDFPLLDNIFNNIYIPLCSIYGFQLNIMLFTVLTGIDYSYVSKLNHKTVLDNTVSEDNYNAQSYIRKWHVACESGLYGNVANHSSIGSMFLLKAVYGYQETQSLRIESDAFTPTLTTSQLKTLTQSELPTLPDADA